jgi:hypothetical protein
LRPPPPLPLRNALELMETRLESGAPCEALLAFVAGSRVEIPEDELGPARRRAMLVLAAGGDPHRELELDSPAIQALARDLAGPERRDALAAGLESLRDDVAGLPLVAALLTRLEQDPDLAWRAFALALLADELAAE